MSKVWFGGYVYVVCVLEQEKGLREEDEEGGRGKRMRNGEIEGNIETATSYNPTPIPIPSPSPYPTLALSLT